MNSVDRRFFLKLFGAAAAAATMMRPGMSLAEGIDTLTIAWTSDGGTWDPNQRLSGDPQSILKCVYDQPLDQAADLSLVPGLIEEWKLSDDAKSLKVKLRGDVKFHDGSALTTQDLKYTFLDRAVAGHQIDIATVWAVEDVEILSDTEAVMKFKSPMPTAPQWLAFQGSFIVSKAYVEKVGVEGLQATAMGTGPYKVASYERESRVVFERNEDYWGEKPSIRKLIFQFIHDPSARLAALMAGQVDLATELPVRDILRFQQGKDMVGLINPISRILILTVRADGVFADKNVRLAAHHAIDKAALSKAFFGGGAVPISVPTVPGMPGNPSDFVFDYNPDKAKELLAASGFSAENPVKLRLGTTNGLFPSDFDIARAVAQMWKSVGISAEIETNTEAQWYELNASGKLQDATLFGWDNGTGDPELFVGYLFNGNLPFATYREKTLTDKANELFGIANYEKRITAYTAFNREVVEEGAIIPLLQAVQTIGHRNGIVMKPYGNGWIVPKAITKA